MHSAGRLIASGRDADIFESGPGLVLRRSRDGRSLAAEARTMEFLHRAGYPVPCVEGLSDDGVDMVLERIEGMSMLEAVGRAPWSIRAQGRVLADLHARLHEIRAPAFVGAAAIGVGDRFVHLDLHPLNVIVSPKGPVVIDWSNAAAGDPDVDVGLAWVLMAAGEIPGNLARAKLLALGRRLLVRAFLARFDVGAIAPKLRSAVEWKVRDPHMSASEIESMWRVVEEAER
jgi:aminoglycoside phosphotransferase (APT) family kinase protein